MGKRDKRKRSAPEEAEIKGSSYRGRPSPSIPTGGYGFLISLFTITIITLLIYSNTFSVPFHFDDTPNIVGNYQIRDLSNFWLPSGRRYIGYLSFAINYYFGGLDVFGYHRVDGFYTLSPSS